ncbi:MAG TPA: hypothetical protein PK646_06435 [Bacillota bacterium]|nr:hypothetical protein [Bacillota bacterium]HQB81706.1 hypothetical protein [Bacillota bacterium]
MKEINRNHKPFVWLARLFLLIAIVSLTSLAPFRTEALGRGDASPAEGALPQSNDMTVQAFSEDGGKTLVSSTNTDIEKLLVSTDTARALHMLEGESCGR